MLLFPLSGLPGPPSFPQHVTVDAVTPFTADISWQPPADEGGRTDTFYNISYSKIQASTIYPEQEPINSTHYTLTELDPCSIYYVLVIAENGISSQAGGQSQRSVGQFFQTTEGSKFGKGRKSMGEVEKRETWCYFFKDGLSERMFDTTVN